MKSLHLKDHALEGVIAYITRRQLEIAANRGVSLCPPPSLTCLVDKLSFVHEAAAHLARSAPEKDLWSNRTGAYLCIAEGSTGFPLLVSVIGSPNPVKAATYFWLCQEKALRLGEHPTHLTSHQSRSQNPYDMQFGGAVRARHGTARLIISCSGYPELGDEALMLAYGMVTEICTTQQAIRAGYQSGNLRYLDLLEPLLEDEGVILQ